jgi:hypothetical protein
MKESFTAETTGKEQTAKIFQFPNTDSGAKDASFHQKKKPTLKRLNIKGKLLLILYYFGSFVAIIPILVLIAYFFHLFLVFPVALVLGVLIGILGGEIEFRMKYLGPRW